MALLEMVTISIGAAIAKQMVGAWLGNGLTNEFGQQLLDRSIPGEYASYY